MPSNITGFGRKLADLAARVKARNERRDESTKDIPKWIERPASTDPSSPRAASLQEESVTGDMPRGSILEYVPVTWTDSHSIADTDSTITSSKAHAKALAIPSSIYANGDPSRRIRLSVRADRNDAVQRISSILPSRDGSSLYYIENGRLGPSKLRQVHLDQGHRYCCPDREVIGRWHEDTAADMEQEIRSTNGIGHEIEVTGPGWRFQALERQRAGHWSLTDFSEQHLADRLFFNASLYKPAEHLSGSQKATAQDLEAMYKENTALRASASKAMANANYLEARVKSLRTRLDQMETGIAEMKLLLDDPNGEGLSAKTKEVDEQA